MSEIDPDDVQETALIKEAQMDRKELATELRKALGDDEPIKAVTKELLANHLALLEETGLDQREDSED